MNKQVHIRQLGLVDYQQAWQEQERLFNGIIQHKIDRRNGTADQSFTDNYLLFCQHPHVYTLGKSGKPENLLITAAQLADLQATYYHINRGGDITYHGPGQLVVYPILDLDNFFTDIHQYLRLLEEAVIRTLADFGMAAGRIAGLTGVWIDHEAQIYPRKICAMGVKTSRWVTMHGLALNVNPNLSYFDYIVPCGIQDKAVTSMEKELDGVQNIEAVQQRLLHHLVILFEMQPVYEADTVHG